MPKYELMYILASSVSDDQVPTVTEQVKNYIESFGGTNLVETQLGKKKLAYPIKKTRNGHYVVINFDMGTEKINELDAKIRTQNNTIIRFILVNLDEHLMRMEKDIKAQATLNRNPALATKAMSAESGDVSAQKLNEPTSTQKQPVIELNAEELDKKIEAALAEDLIK